MKKFGVRDQVGYMLGDVGGSFVNLYIGSFLHHLLYVCIRC